MASKTQISKEFLNIPQLTPDEEDVLIHTRITNDERPLRRLAKKFHTYSSVAYPPIVETPSLATTSVEEMRESFLIELSSFQLLLRKGRMVCDAEHRQVDLYKQESSRIGHEHVTLRNEIEELKMTLEQAQLERRRKIEYDQIAEKINALPTREELELSIGALENDIQIIRDEHETQNRSILSRKNTLDEIVADISHLRILGKDTTKVDASGSRAPSELPETESEQTAGMEVDVEEGVTESGPDEGRSKEGSVFISAAKPFSPRPSTPLLQTATHQLRVQNSMSNTSNLGLTPSVSRDATPIFTPVGGPDSSPLSPVDSSSPAEDGKREEGEDDEEGEEGEEAEDVEMGEVSEEKNANKGKKAEEDREEGEASDESSVLSDPPDE